MENMQISHLFLLPLATMSSPPHLQPALYLFMISFTNSRNSALFLAFHVQKKNRDLNILTDLTVVSLQLPVTACGSVCMCTCMCLGGDRVGRVPVERTREGGKNNRNMD